MSQSACLAGVAAAFYSRDYIEFAFTARDFKRTLYFSLYDFHCDVIVQRFAVYGNVSSTRE